MVQTFEQFLQTHKDEIEVLQILYSKPYAAGLSLKDVKSLAGMLQKPIDGSPRATPDQLWHAYERLDASHVRGTRTEVAADLVNLVRFALKQKSELMPRRAEVEGTLRCVARVSRRARAWSSAPIRCAGSKPSATTSPPAWPSSRTTLIWIPSSPGADSEGRSRFLANDSSRCSAS